MLSLSSIIPLLTLLSIPISASEGKAFKLLLSSTPDVCLGYRGTDAHAQRIHLEILSAGCQESGSGPFIYNQTEGSIKPWYNESFRLEAEKPKEENSDLTFNDFDTTVEGQKWEILDNNRIKLQNSDFCLSVAKNGTDDEGGQKYMLQTKTCGDGEEKPEDDIYQIWTCLFLPHF